MKRLPVVASLAAGLFILVPTAGSSAAPPANVLVAAPDPSQYDKLNKQLDALEKKYGGDMALLRDVQQQVKDSMAKQTKLKTQLDAARATVAQLATAQYMGSPADPLLGVLSSGDPERTLENASVADLLARNRNAKISEIKTLVDQQNQAAADAQKKLAELKQGLKDMEGQRTKLKALVGQYKPQSPLVGNNSLTQRMISVRTEIDTRFGPFPAIGCYRAGDPQDHGVGKACDFMESSGGVMPTAARQAHGDQVAAWAIANAGRLGIKYIIWKQRIYDMRSPGWRAMSDRGGITANHYDHVHVSVF